MKKLKRVIAIVLTGMVMLASCSKGENLIEKETQHEGNQTTGQNSQGAGG